MLAFFLRSINQAIISIVERQSAHITQQNSIRIIANFILGKEIQKLYLRSTLHNKPMINLNDSKGIFASAVIGVLAGFGSFSLKEKTSRSSSDSSHKNQLTSAKSIQDRRSQASEALKLAEHANPETVTEFAKHWLSLHPDDRDFIVGQLGGWYIDDADKYYEFIRDFSLEIFSQDRPLGLGVVAIFRRDSSMRNLERHLLDQWVAIDQTELFTTLTTSAQEGNAINPTHLHQLASIYENEKADQFSDFTSWVHGLDQSDSHSYDLQHSAYGALSFHCPPEHRPELYAHLLERVEEERFQIFPALIIGTHAVENPEEATTWLEDLEPGPWKEQALFRFLDTAGEHQAEAGANLMNREQFMSEFAIPWEETPDGGIQVSNRDFAPEFFENFYDSTLERFLSTALSANPDLVFESAEAFYNPQYKKDYQAAALDALNGVTPISTSPAHSCGPNCNHEHHQH